MSRKLCVPALALAAAVLGANIALNAATPVEPSMIGVIKAPSFEQAKAQASAWLQTSPPDAAKRKTFEAIWNPAAEASLLDRVAETLALGDVGAKQLLMQAREYGEAPPVAAPALLKDGKHPVFFRANLALAYAKEMTNRRVHEEALEALKIVRPEQVVDPASYYFFKAVAEHKLQLKNEGLASVNRLLESVPDAPERYRVVAELMKQEMETWRDKDLGHIARLMDSIERRLDLARGGPKTQKQQQEVLGALDKMIEDMEKQQSECQKSGAQGPANRSGPPLLDSQLGGQRGEGHVENKRILKNVEAWGKLPEKERIKAMEQLKRDYPAHYREAMEEYLRLSAKGKSE